MVELITNIEKNESKVKLSQEKHPIQEEIVLSAATMLAAFRDKAMKAGISESDADAEVKAMLVSISRAYTEILENSKNKTQEE